MNSISGFLRVAMLTVAVAGCGGGGGGDAPPPPAPGKLTLVGTVAIGTPAAGKTVQAQCATGSGSATTGSDGAYSLTIDTALLPCLLRATLAPGDLLHSVTQGSGSTVTTNITTVTELVVAALSGKDPEAFYATPSFGIVTPTAVSAAVNKVVATLKSGGVDFSAISGGTLLTAPFTATAGNAYDDKLEALQASLDSSGTTLEELTTTLAHGSPSGTTTGTASLPADLLLRPKAATCASLRSGTYRGLTLRGLSGGAVQGKFDVNASTLTMVFDDGGSSVYIPDTANCKFKSIDNLEHFAVSPAGVIVFTYSDFAGGPTYLDIAFPEQTIPLSQVAGTWNLQAFTRDTPTGPFDELSAVLTFTANGVVTQNADCIRFNPCVATPLPYFSLSVDPAGGFLSSQDDMRVFAFQSGGGETVLFGVSTSGEVFVGAPAKAVAMPELGDVNRFWSVSAGANGQPAADFTAYMYTISAVDPVAKTSVRVSAADGHAETIQHNTPADGRNYRPAANAPTTGGGTFTVSENFLLPLRGTGVTAFGRPAGPLTPFFGFSVAQP